MHAHTRTRTHTHAHACTHTYARTHTHTHAHTHACTHTCMHTLAHRRWARACHWRAPGWPTHSACPPAARKLHLRLPPGCTASPPPQRSRMPCGGTAAPFKRQCRRHHAASVCAVLMLEPQLWACLPHSPCRLRAPYSFAHHSLLMPCAHSMLVNLRKHAQLKGPWAGSLGVRVPSST